MKIAQLLEELDCYIDRIPLDVLSDRLAQLEISMDEISPCVHYDDRTYRRNLLHEGRAYQALILCWLNGQRSPIHDHKGSSCGVKIIQGEATETIFGWAKNGMIIPTETKEYCAGTSMGSQDADIHQVSNLAADGATLVTLHIYSPPLEVMNVYSLMGGEEQRVHDFVVGPATTSARSA